MQLTIINHFDGLFCFCLTGITLLSGPLQPFVLSARVCRDTHDESPYPGVLDPQR